MTAREARRAGRIQLAVALLLTAGFTIVGLAGLTRWLEVPPGQNRFNALKSILQTLEELRSPLRDATRARIAYLGDSTVATFKPTHRLPTRLQALLRAGPPSRRGRAGARARVYDLSYPAMGTFSFYFLADLIAAAEPDLVVWQVSFTHLSPNWRETLVRKELSGWMDFRRVGEVLMLPLEYTGLTLDQFLLYQAIASADALPLWMRVIDEQSRMGGLKDNREVWLKGIVGTTPEKRFRHSSGFARKRRIMRPDRPDRYDHDAERVHYGDSLTGLDRDHPVLRVLRAGLQVYRDAGIPVLVYLNPINVENLAAVGALDPEILRGSVGVYHEVVEASGARFVDLHDLLSDSGFKDAQGHFSEPPDEDAGERILRALLPHVLDGLRVRAESRRPL